MREGRSGRRRGSTAVELAFVIPVFVLFAIAIFQFQSIMRAGMRAITESNYDARLQAVSVNAGYGNDFRIVTGRGVKKADLLFGWRGLFEPYSTIEARTHMLAGTNKQRGTGVHGVVGLRSGIICNMNDR